MGLANLMADAISMGLGDALSEKAEVDFQMREWKREAWEMDENPEGEVQFQKNSPPRRATPTLNSSRTLVARHQPSTPAAPSSPPPTPPPP